MILGSIAEAYGQMGRLEDGLYLLAEARTIVDKTGERWWEAELHRLKGEMLLVLHGTRQTEATTCLQHALALARRQQAKSLELGAPGGQKSS